MNQVERFFHIRPKSLFDGSKVGITATRGGATIRVVGSTPLVTVQVAYCSANDAFCRKTGRDVATQHTMRHVPLDNLPGVLQDVARTVTGRVLKLSHSKRKQHPLWDLDFSFSTKYFKEKVSA
jgi:hypothetical protein